MQLYCVVLISLGFCLFTRCLFNVNTTSLHRLYRNPLAETYLQENKYGIQKISELENNGPYHLLNTVINIPNSEKNLRGRNGDFFIFSKCFCGSEVTGYCTTTQMEKADPNVDLGTALAISGAAVNPNMGKENFNGFVTFLIAMLNVRLGYWAPNPKSISKKPHIGSSYLLQEMLGRLNENSDAVNLSDGGHLDNSGIYELLRRKCKYIIAFDGEADPQYRFSGLASAIRYARIDLDVEIQFHDGLETLKKQANGRSIQHYATADIIYADGQKGHLLYIKSSLTGDEEIDVESYAAQDLAFPHQSTADQLFDEAQFEAYRALGQHIGNDIFSNLSNTDLFDIDIRFVEDLNHKTISRDLENFLSWKRIDLSKNFVMDS